MRSHARVVTEATVGVYERPTPLSSVQVRYTVRAAGGGEIIESSGDDPRTFIVSDGPLSGVLPCIDVGVREMRKGERDVLLAPAGWAYASPEYVPPDAAAYTSAVEKAAEGVEVEIELIDFTRGKDFYQLTADEKLAEMAKYRENGNRLFKAGHFKRAARRYEEALKKEPKEKDDFASVASAEKAARLEEVRKIKLSAHLNLAACHLKLNEPQLALEQSNGALEIEPTSVKALYRRRRGCCSAMWRARGAIFLRRRSATLRTATCARSSRGSRRRRRPSSSSRRASLAGCSHSSDARDFSCTVTSTTTVIIG